MVEADGLGGACVLTDCVPSKTLIATSETMVLLRGSAGLGIGIRGRTAPGGAARPMAGPGRPAARAAGLDRRAPGSTAG